MSRKLKAEIEKVEQELNTLTQVKAHMIAGHTEADIVKEMDVLSTVHQRMLAAMPAAGEPKPERKKRTPKGLPKPNGKGKDLTA